MERKEAIWLCFVLQARGRGRAEDSSYTVVEEAGSGVAERESVNEYREKMMSKAIARVCTLSREEYEKKVRVNHDCIFFFYTFSNI